MGPGAGAWITSGGSRKGGGSKKNKRADATEEAEGAGESAGEGAESLEGCAEETKPSSEGVDELKDAAYWPRPGSSVVLPNDDLKVEREPEPGAGAREAETSGGGGAVERESVVAETPGGAAPATPTVQQHYARLKDKQDALAGAGSPTYEELKKNQQTTWGGLQQQSTRRTDGSGEDGGEDADDATDDATPSTSPTDTPDGTPPLRVFTPDAAPPTVAECDPGYVGAVAVEHPLEGDLVKDLLGEAAEWDVRERGAPSPPVIRTSMAQLLHPATRRAHWAEQVDLLVRKHAPDLDQGPTFLTTEVACQAVRGVLAAHDAHTRRGGEEGFQPAWGDIFSDAVETLRLEAVHPVRDLLGLIQEDKQVFRGTEGDGAYELDRGAGLPPVLLNTAVLYIGSSKVVENEVPVATVIFRGQEFDAYDGGEAIVGPDGEIYNSQCVKIAIGMGELVEITPASVAAVAWEVHMELQVEGCAAWDEMADGVQD